MRKIISGLIAALFLAPASLAEPVNPDTRAGYAVIIEDLQGTRALQLGPNVYRLPTDPLIAFIEARRGDLLLVGLSQGGNACPAQWIWVHAMPGDVRFSPVFGTCADMVEVTNDHETVTVTMPSFEPGKGNVSFVYDGRTITTRQEGLSASGMAPGDGPAFWIDKYPYDLITAADYQDQFSVLMGAGALKQAQGMLGVSGPMERDGDWVAGSGCTPHMCGVEEAAIAINLTDGRLLVATWRAGTPPQVWGNPGGAFPAEIARILSMQ